MENGKKWYLSKTILFNILSGLVGIAVSLQSDKGVPPQIAEILGSVVLVGNIVLRLITSEPITK